MGCFRIASQVHHRHKVFPFSFCARVISSNARTEAHLSVRYFFVLMNFSSSRVWKERRFTCVWSLVYGHHSCLSSHLHSYYEIGGWNITWKTWHSNNNKRLILTCISTKSSHLISSIMRRVFWYASRLLLVGVWNNTRQKIDELSVGKVDLSLRPSCHFRVELRENSEMLKHKIWL